MTELNIKQEIGKRLLEARKAKGLTLKALGELVGDLKQTRLTNWEQGTRTPGVEEIKQLAHALEISPAFLMCLSDEKELKKNKTHSHLIPLLDTHQASKVSSYVQLSDKANLTKEAKFIAVSTELLPNLSDNSFALKVIDESMMPEFQINDVLIIDSVSKPKPGDFVVIKMDGQSNCIICQYKKLSFTSPEFELITLNDNWPNIKPTDDIKIKILGIVVQKIQQYHSHD